MKRLMMRYEGGSEVKLLEGVELCPKLVSAAIELVLGVEDEYGRITRQMASRGFVWAGGCMIYIEDVA
jgi:hypothetical protein